VSKVSIELASAADLDAMADLLAELFTLESDFVPEREKQLRGLRLIMDNPHSGRLFVVRVGGQIAGMANALLTISTAEGCRVMLLEDVIVKAGWRGRRLGRRLVEHILDWAATNGLARVTLLADAGNSPALAFYEHLGFGASSMQVWRKKLPGGVAGQGDQAAVMTGMNML
jgi:GNAT superfamily N-acetyltransferase